MMTKNAILALYAQQLQAAFNSSDDEQEQNATAYALTMRELLLRDDVDKQTVALAAVYLCQPDVVNFEQLIVDMMQ